MGKDYMKLTWEGFEYLKICFHYFISFLDLKNIKDFQI